MIDLEQSYVYKTVEDKTVIILPKYKDLAGKRIYVGIVEGQQAYGKWTEDGNVFDSSDVKFNLKDTH